MKRVNSAVISHFISNLIGINVIENLIKNAFASENLAIERHALAPNNLRVFAPSELSLVLRLVINYSIAIK